MPCRAARPTGRSCASSVLRSAGSGWSAAPEVAEQRPPLVGERRREAGGRVEGLGDLEELRRVEAAAAHGPADPRLDVVGRPDAHPGAVLEQLPGLVGLVQAAPDDDRVVGRLEGLGEAARRLERRLLGEPGADGRELEERDRAGVHHLRARRLSDGLPATRNRHGTAAPGLARVPDPDPRASSTIPGGGSSPGGASRRSGDAGSHRSMPVWTPVDGERGAHEPGARGEPRIGTARAGVRSTPGTAARGPSPPARRASPRCPRRARRRARAAPRAAAGSVTTLRQWCIP